MEIEGDLGSGAITGAYAGGGGGNKKLYILALPLERAKNKAGIFSQKSTEFMYSHFLYSCEKFRFLHKQASTSNTIIFCPYIELVKDLQDNSEDFVKH